MTLANILDLTWFIQTQCGFHCSLSKTRRTWSTSFCSAKTNRNKNNNNKTKNTHTQKPELHALSRRRSQGLSWERGWHFYSPEYNSHPFPLTPGTGMRLVALFRFLMINHWPYKLILTGILQYCRILFGRDCKAKPHLFFHV